MLQIDGERIKTLSCKELSQDRTWSRAETVYDFLAGLKPLT
jgi:hypothetical protein